MPRSNQIADALQSASWSDLDAFAERFIREVSYQTLDPRRVAAAMIKAAQAGGPLFIPHEAPLGRDEKGSAR